MVFMVVYMDLLSLVGIAISLVKLKAIVFFSCSVNPCPFSVYFLSFGNFYLNGNNNLELP